MVIGEKLKFIREQKGLSMGKLSRLSGVSNTLISNIEKGAATTFSTAEKLADALNLDIKQLFLTTD